MADLYISEETADDIETAAVDAATAAAARG